MAAPAAAVRSTSMTTECDASTTCGQPGRAYIRRSTAAILAHQQPNGALLASRDFATYHYCWLRDGAFTAFALDRAGEHAAAARFHGWVAAAVAGIAELIDEAVSRHVQGAALPGRMPPARFGLDGKAVADDWPNFQIDGYGTWLWALERHVQLAGLEAVPVELLESVRMISRYVESFALVPCYDVWEEHCNAMHNSTLACVYGGLVAAARMLGASELLARAREVRDAAREDIGRLGRFVKSTQSDAVDASLLWLATPFKLVDPTDREFVATVRVIERDLTFEGGVRRYAADTYYGSGAWPVLTASLGWHYATIGDLAAAGQCLRWVSRQFDADGRLPEQVGGERRDPAHYEQWAATWGQPAADLAWSHAMYIVLATEIECRLAAAGNDADDKAFVNQGVPERRARPGNTGALRLGD